MQQMGKMRRKNEKAVSQHQSVLNAFKGPYTINSTTGTKIVIADKNIEHI